MLFSSISYFIFFPVVFLLYWSSPKQARRLLLLVASYFFYMSWIPAYGLLIALLTVINYFLAFAIEKFRAQAKAVLIFGLAVNLGTLCFYKYTNFLIGTAQDMLRGLAPWLPPAMSAASFPELNIILPLGISFFAFEFIHYLSDVYKGDKAIRSPIDFALFAAFFPSQIAGPIKRFQDFMQQLSVESCFDGKLCSQGAGLLVQGLFKKIALSDNLAIIANQGFNAAQTSAGTAESWLAALAFTFQIYFDFSGYTDMGRGSAMMLGYKLPDNFNLPYLASSMTDFWKRWHISLSSWLRDYLYIPLGGGRCSAARKNYNLLVTMLLGGLWHGAAWHFVAWGGLHGGLLIINHRYDDLVKRTPALQSFHGKPLAKALAVLITFTMVLISWVFFRAETVSQALQMLQVMFLEFKSSPVLVGTAGSGPLYVALAAYCIYALLSYLSQKNLRLKLWSKQFELAAPARAIAYAGAAFAAIGFAPTAPSPFIYFQF